MKCLQIVIVTTIVISQCVGYNDYEYDYEDSYKHKESSYSQRPQHHENSQSQRDSTYNQENYRYEPEEYSQYNADNKQSNYPSADEYDDDDEYENKPRPYYDLKDSRHLFDEFKKKFHKQYKNAQDERQHYEYFMKNLKVVNDLNAEGGSATFGITLHADRKPSD